MLLLRRTARPPCPAATARLWLSRGLRVESGNRIVAEVPGGSNISLHPEWLRERCTSPLSVQSSTKQPLHQPHEFAWPMEIESALVDESEGALRVKFSDGHESVYDARDLELEVKSPAAVGVQVRDIALPQPELWTGSLSPERFAYSDIVLGIENKTEATQEVDSKMMMKLMKRLLTHGHAVITGAPARNMEVSRFAQCITQFPGDSTVRSTNWGQVFNVLNVPDSGRKDLAYTSAALPPHVDNPYRDPNPGYQLLHALENKCHTTGGSFAVDGFEVCRQLREEDPDMFRVLCQVPCRWENDGGDGSSALFFWGPHIAVNSSSGQVEQIRYSPKSGGYAPALKDESTMDLFYRARRRFAELLNDEGNKSHFRLEEGEIWIFNNLRVLHGRNEFDPTEGRRHFQGAYIDVDGIQSSYFRNKYNLQGQAGFSCQIGNKGGESEDIELLSNNI